MKFCLRLIQKYGLKLTLFFDEPDNYLNPELINELVNLMSSIKNCSIYMSSHNPYFISYLLNKINQKNINLYRLEMVQNNTEPKISKIKIKEKQYIVPSLLIYEIYGVCTIDLLDFYIEKLGNYPENSEEKYELDKGKSDEKIIEKMKEKMNDKIKTVDKYFKKNIRECKCIENGSYKHFSIIHLVRNYYHHPSARVDMQNDMNKKMNNKAKNIEVLLRYAIENIRELLDANNCSAYKLDFENCNN